MRPQFNERKATQVAALLLAKAPGKEMSYMKLIKLMYLVERKTLAETGRPVTFDHYVSMDRGPVLSRTYNLMYEGNPPSVSSLWSECISDPDHYSVSLNQPCAPDDLSDAELKAIDDVFEEWGGMNQWKLVDELHEFPEWQDPQGSSIPITYRDILTAIGRTPMEISAIEAEIDSLGLADQVFGPDHSFA